MRFAVARLSRYKSVMKIGGLQPVTLLDYPQKVAAIIFTLGCDMRCPFCYNPNLVWPDLIKKANLLPETDLFSFLKRRRKYLDGVCLTGGEPLLQPDLISFLEKIKKLGYSVKLDTNGLRPDILKKLMAGGLIDYAAMDIKGPLEQYEKFCGVKINGGEIKKSIGLIIKSGLDYEFRSTLVKGLHKKSDIVKMAKLIKGAGKYFLQNFNPQAVLVGGKFKGASFTQKEMAEFCRLAGKYVNMCKVR